MGVIIPPGDMAKPGTPTWQTTITASKIPIILDLSPYQTPGELWMLMTGHTTPQPLEGDHLDWGHIAEDSLAKWWAHEHPGWQIGRQEIAYTDPDLPFPNQATLDRRARRGRRFHIIECKTSNSTTTWKEGIPDHIYAQVQAQMGISGIHEASIVHQLHSTIPKITPIEWDPKLWDHIVTKVTTWVDTLTEEEPPTPNPASMVFQIEQPTISTSEELALDPEDPDLMAILRLDTYRQAVDQELASAKQALEARARGRRITVGGKTLASSNPGRFGVRNLPRQAQHLATDPDVMTPKFDPKKFQTKYPDIAAIATGAPTTSWRLATFHKGEPQ